MSETAGSLLQLSGGLSGSGGLNLSGGRLVLSGSDTYTGGTTIDAGTLQVTTSDALPDASSLVVGAGGTFIFDPTVVAGSGEQGTGSRMASVPPVPEPGTIALLVAAAVAGLGAWRKKRALSAEYTVSSTECEV